jgi:hypothetical protein
MSEARSWKRSVLESLESVYAGRAATSGWAWPDMEAVVMFKMNLAVSVSDVAFDYEHCDKRGDV